MTYRTIAVKEKTKREFDKQRPDGMSGDAFLKELLEGRDAKIRAIVRDEIEGLKIGGY